MVEHMLLTLEARALSLAAAGSSPVGSSPVQAWWAAVSTDATAFGVRAGLTAGVLLVALLTGRWLAHQAGRVMARDDEPPQNGRRIWHWHLIRRRDHLGPVLASVTQFCVWFAAFAALTGIWFYGAGIPTPSPRELGAEAGDLIVRIGGSLIIVALALALGRVLQQGALGGLTEGRLNRNLQILIARCIYTATLILGLVVILAIWGTGLVLPVTLLGALTVALSLALQDILRNVVSGIYLLLEHPFAIGDHISAVSFGGEVEDIQLRVTVLRTADNQKVLIPNALLFTSPVLNHSGYERRRAALTVALPDAASTSVADAEHTIIAALADVPSILADPAPQVTVSKAAAGKVELRVEFWLPTTVTGDGAILSQAIGQVRARLRDADVAMLDDAAVPA